MKTARNACVTMAILLAWALAPGAAEAQSVARYSGPGAIPNLMGFTVKTRSSSISAKGERLLVFHLADTFRPTVDKFMTMYHESRVFAGCRVTSWSEDLNVKRWFFRVLSPKGESFRITVVPDPSGGSVLTLNTADDSSTLPALRRPYGKGDVGPQP